MKGRHHSLPDHKLATPTKPTNPNPAAVNHSSSRSTSWRRQRSPTDKNVRSSNNLLGGEQVEGKRAVIELLNSRRRRVDRLYLVEKSFRPAELQAIVALADDRGIKPIFLSSSDLAALARTTAPQGVVAMAEPVTPVSLGDLCASATKDAPSQPGLIVVLDGLTDPGNLGSLIRSTECAGGTGMVLPRRRGVHLTPAAVKAAAGAVEYLPISVVPGIPACLSELHERGVWSICLAPGSKEVLTELPILTEPLAIVLGSEGNGVSRLAMERCDVVASIPQSGKISSLNVAVAAAAALYLIRYIRAS